MSDVLNVAVRETVGTSAARRLRREGGLPAILYGHGQANVNLAVNARELDAVVRHGGKLVNLKGGVTDTALIREMQWDAFGTHVLHLDLTRVSAQERVELTIGVELRGDAIGLNQGGMLEHMLYEVDVECAVAAIPERFSVSVKDLGVGQAITVADIEVPDGVKVLTPPETVVVQCVKAAVEEEEGEAEGLAGEGVEPEVIGRKAEEAEGEGS